MEKVKFENAVQQLRKFSEKIQSANDDNNELVNQLNNISKEGRASLFASYQNTKGPVKEIRKQVAEILNSRNITLAELQNIIDKSVSENPNSFRSMYKGWYNILYMFLIQDFRNKMNEAVDFISNSIINELDDQNRIIAKKFDFTGERETGSTRCWIAIINKTHPSQTTAKQLFININNGNIEFCFYDRPNEHRIDNTILIRTEELNPDDLLSVFKKHLPEIFNDVFEERIKYWRLGTSDGKNNYWENMRTNNKISIGWSEIGDLTEAKVKSKKDVVELLTNEGFYNDDKRTKSRKAGEILSFYKTIKIGDIVLAQDGSSVLGIGKVAGDYSFNENENFAHEKKIHWLVENPNLSNSDGLRTTCVELTNENLISQIKSLLNSINSTDQVKNLKTKIDMPLNSILYGPPGTGKTYNSIDMAVKIAAFERYSERHIDNKKVFDDLRRQGQIEFVTFHQNYSYEDFMIGLSPDVSEESFLKFERKFGVFYKICKRAEDNFLKSQSSLAGEVYVSFEEVWNEFLKELPSIKPKFGTSTIYRVYDFNETRLFFETSEGKREKWQRILKDKIKGYFEGNFKYIGGYDSYYSGLKVKLDEIKKLLIERNKTTNTELANYVIVIDEINRANISKVFGELITLLEDDKRLGEPNELKVTLPNGEIEFGVPPNLYLIGTMNTADKSISLIDIALRRRFEFIGKYPDYNQISNVAAKLLLQKINEEIYKLKNSADYLIGHAYFMNDGAIEKTLRNKVLPLLMEYFSGKTKIVSDIFNETSWKVEYDIANFDWVISQR